VSRLLLLRHGQSAWNAERRLQGQADPPLTAEGEAQARAAGALLEGQDVRHAVCSDLRRARRSAALAGFPEARLDPGWREIKVGDWSGRSVDDLRAEDRDAWRGWRAGRFTPPGAESWSAFAARIGEALAEFGGAEPTLAVTHGGVIRAVLSILLEIPPDRLAPIPPGSLTVVETGAWPRLRVYGATPTFGGQDAPD